MPLHALRPIAFLALFCPVATAAAGQIETPTVFCIANSTQLKAAFAQMAADADTAPARYRLQIQQGNYFPPILGMIGALNAPISSIELLGGYDAGCASRTIDPTNTSLNLGATDSQPQIGFTLRGDILVEGLSLISAYPSVQTSTNDVLALRQAPGSLRRQHWQIRQSIFQGKAAQGDANPDNGALNAVVGAVDTPPVSLAVENVIAKGFGDGDCVFQYREIPLAFPLPGHELVFSHATIAYNSTCAIEAEGLHAQSRVVLTNNVIAQNGGSSVTTAGHADANVELHNNVLTSAKAIGNNLVLERGTLTNNPLLVSYADPRPGVLSAAINSGTTYIAEGLSAMDLRGATRWVGSRPDRGAIEAADADDTTHYVVTNTDDSGAGSLRAAVEAASAEPGPARVVFNIVENGSAACPAVIRLDDQVMITDDIIVDGFSQPGSVANTLEDGDNAVRCIALDGGLKGSAAFRSYDADTSLMVMRGMEFGGFGPNGSAIHASGPDEFVSFGNRFGAEMPLVEDWSRTNGEAIHVSGSDQDANKTDFASVGSLRDAGARNVFNENREAFHVYRSRSTFLSNIIQSPDGRGGINMMDVAEGGAIVSNRMNSRIDIVAKNAEALAGILRISNNMIGIELKGIQFSNFGGSGGIRRVWVEENVLDAWAWLNGSNANGARPTEVCFTRNATDADGIAFSLADFRSDVTQNGNDVIQSIFQKPANGGLNFPILEAADGAITEGVVTGNLQTRTGKYVVEVFASAACDASGHGDGEELVGIGTVAVQDTGTENGISPFQIAIASQQAFSGRAITATATDEMGNTSEFSACVTYLGPTEEVFRDGFEEP